MRRWSNGQIWVSLEEHGGVVASALREVRSWENRGYLLCCVTAAGWLLEEPVLLTPQQRRLLASM